MLAIQNAACAAKGKGKGKRKAHDSESESESDSGAGTDDEVQHVAAKTPRLSAAESQILKGIPLKVLVARLGRSAVETLLVGCLEGKPVTRTDVEALLAPTQASLQCICSSSGAPPEAMLF